MDQTLHQRLNPVVQRIRFCRAMIALAIVWIAAALIAGLLLYLNRTGNLDPSNVWWWLAGGSIVASVAGVILAIFKSKSAEQVAWEIEKQYPELDASLITAIEQKPKDGELLGFLQQDVMRTVVTHSYQNSWVSLIPGWHLVAAPAAGLIGLVAFAITMICLVWFVKPIPVDPTIAFADAAVDATNFTIFVEPGNAEVERGTSLLVLARFAESFPPEASLAFVNAEGIESKVPMSKSLDDPVFGARISSVSQPLTYRIQYADRETDSYDVTVFDIPKLDRADATLKYPAYTEVEDRVVQDFRRLNAVEGTTAELSFFVNKPVISAVLFPQGSGEPIDLIVDPNDPKKLTAKIKMEQSEKYELELTDASHRDNRTPPKFVLNVVENRPPDLKILAPGRDVDASPIEEVQLSASAWDDFGLKSFGVNFGIPGRDDQELTLEQKQAGNKRKMVDHLLDLESLQAQPDDLVSYYFWAEDMGPDGQIRRVSSDMYFAEVRHFDEIFRQGQAPPAGQQQQQQQQQQGGENAQQAQKLAELQKEIINGTWKMIRREQAGKLTERFGSDSELLAESQTAAIAALAELAEKLEDPESLSFIDPVRTFMNEAVLNLTQANHDADVKPLKPALSSEQAAYQGLLKLRAREHEVVRQQRQQQPGQAQQQNNRSQQQLDQLNLKDDENRYENEKTAQQQNEQTQQQQEDRQVLSRLRELARRQDDLNERVKELQSALEEAKTEEEKAEIERRLKSLREQQEQMLRDAEELLERMKGEENQQRMAEESEKLEQTRENLQRAAEALEQNEVSRAAAEGTRAQRDLEELRDEFQKRTSGQFTEQMRELRNQAQDLEKKQEDIAQQLSDQPKIEKQDRVPTLRDTEEEKPKVGQQLADQKRAVEELREQMRKTIEEAEPFEPLLAEELYDTYRDSEVSRPDEALESARRSFDRGWVEDARVEEQRAREGIEEMREGIEKAAESVLGDETDALKAAQETLRDLNRDLQNEIKQSDPSQTGPSQESEPSAERENGQQRPGPGQQPDQERERQQRERQREQGQTGQPNDNQNPEPREGEPREGEPSKGEQGNGQAQQPGQNENQPGEAKPQEGQPQEGQPQNGQQPQDGQQPGGQRGGEPQGGQPGGNPEDRDAAEQMRQQMRNLGANEIDDRGGAPNMLDSAGGNQRMLRPLTGDDFRDWSDRLRDVEEMVADPDLRAEASRIREQAREIRKDMKRHSAEPNWDLIKMKVAKPLAELQDRVAEEIMRRGSKDALVPLDRDPVPVQYQDAVRRYYERLGSGQ